jgi:hypothetical protein
MILKAREIKNLSETMDTLLPLQLKMPFAYEVASIAREVRENNFMINAMKQEIVERFAERDDNGQIRVNQEDGTVEVQEGKYAELNAELDKLMNRDIELNSNKIKLVDIKDLDLTVGQISALIPLIDVE